MNYIRVTWRPLSTYPVPETNERRRAPFHRKVPGSWETARRSTHEGTKLLEYEVGHLGASRLIIEADFNESDIKNDGWPRSDRRPRSPRLVVTLPETSYGPLRYPCDTFDRFEDNLYAVGLALEALRKVDRYGVTRRGEQYAGWKQLPGSTAPTMSTETAANLLAQIADGVSSSGVLVSVDHAKAALRAAARVTHPDAPGGSVDKFHAVQTARAVLSSHHGVSL